MPLSVMEPCSGGELFDRIIDASESSTAGMAFGERQAAKYMQQITGAMSYLHGKFICHRDIKPENFLMQNKDPDAPIKIIDFGLAKKFTPGVPMRTESGTPYYIAPEVLSGRYDEKCDVWSCGVITFVLLSGLPPFNGDTDAEILNEVRAGKVVFDPEWKCVSASAKSFITDMLTKDFNSRPSFQSLLGHKWLGEHAEQSPGELNSNLGSRLSKFHKTSKFKKIALTCIAQQLADSDIAELKQAFTLMDKNNDGTLALVEVKEAMEKHKVVLPANFTDILQGLDTDGSGSIDYTEFIAATIEKNKYATDDIMYAAFRLFDKDQDGLISRDELKRMADGACDDSIVQMLKTADLDGDGLIDFQEFKVMMMAD